MPELRADPSADQRADPRADPRGDPSNDPSSDPSCPRSPLGTFAECPHCAGELFPEHAHFRCRNCGWRDSCCD